MELVETAAPGASLEGVTAELREAHPERQIVSDIAVDVPARRDAAHLQQLLSNLLANALSHGVASAPVRVRARVDGEDVDVEVHNEGEPIPANRLDKAFEPFWRRTASREGLGLGLYICSQIVRSHGGRLSVASSAEHGTSFVARLPILA